MRPAVRREIRWTLVLGDAKMRADGERDPASVSPRPTGRNKLIGTIVAAYAIFDFDNPVWLVVLVVGILLNPLFVFAGAVPLVLAFNLWACHWIDREWGRLDRGRAGPEDRGEAREDAEGQVHEPPRPLGDERFLRTVRRRLDGHQSGAHDRRRTHSRGPTGRRAKDAGRGSYLRIIESLLWTAIGYGIGQGVS
jgi:hypothetical protein